MSNIDVDRLQEIVGQMDLIRHEINDVRPFMIKAAEIMELCENLESHAEAIQEEIHTIRRQTTHLENEGLID